MVADGSEQWQTQYQTAGSSGDDQEVAAATVPAVFRVGSGTATSGQTRAAPSQPYGQEMVGGTVSLDERTNLHGCNVFSTTFNEELTF